MAQGARKFRWPILLVVCVLIFLTTGKLHLIRTDSLALAACPLGLAGAQPDENGVVRENREAILVAAKQYDLPPEVLAAIIRGHQSDLTILRRFTDCAGAALGADVSLGPAQVRISTAAGGDGLTAKPLPPSDFARYRSALSTPTSSIRYTAKEVRRLLDRPNRFPGISTENLIRNPMAMALMMGEYRAGERREDANDTNLGWYGAGELSQMLAPGVYIFDLDPAQVRAIQDDIFAFLDESLCGPGSLNRAGCERWRASADYRSRAAAPDSSSISNGIRPEISRAK